MSEKSGVRNVQPVVETITGDQSKNADSKKFYDQTRK